MEVKLLRKKLQLSWKKCIDCGRPTFGAHCQICKGKHYKDHPDFTAQKPIVRDRDNHECFLCGAPEGNIAHVVHHIDYNRENNAMSNLVTLCMSCHSKTGHRREFWERFLMWQTVVFIGPTISQEYQAAVLLRDRTNETDKIKP